MLQQKAPIVVSITERLEDIWIQIQQQCSHPSTLGPDLYRQDSDKNFEIGK